MQQVYKPKCDPCRSVISIKLQTNFIEIALRHGCSPVNLRHIFRTHFPRNTSGWVLLEILMKLLKCTYKSFIHVNNYKTQLNNNFNSSSNNFKIIIHCVKIVRIRSYSCPHFPHLNWIRRDTPYHSIFSPNTGYYGPDQLRIRTIFTQWLTLI